MGSKLMPAGAVQSGANSWQYGTVIANLVEESAAGVIGAIAGDSSFGIPFGFLTDLPEFTVSRETVNILEPVVGLGVRLKGSEQLVGEEATVTFSFVPGKLDLIRYTLPGTTKADWTPAVTASITVGTGNSSVRVRARTGGTAGNSITYAQTAPSGTGAPYATVTVTGTAPSYAISVASKTDATAQNVVDAINAHATARTIVQAGLPAGTTGTGLPATGAATALAGGAAGTKIGSQLTSAGFWALTDYLPSLHVVWESSASQVAGLSRIKNAISMDDFSFQGDDGGQVSGISATFTATSDESDYNATTGNYSGPYAILDLDDVAV